MSDQTTIDAQETPDASETPDAPDAPETETTETTETPDAPTDDAPETPGFDWDSIDVDALAPVTRELLHLTERAEETKDNPTPVSDYLTRLQGVSAYIDALTEEGKGNLASALTEEHLSGTIDAYASLVANIDALTPLASEERVDRSEGDSKRKALLALVDANVMLTDADLAITDALVARWDASAPKSAPKSTSTRTRGAGTGDNPATRDLGFDVVRTCKVCAGQGKARSFTSGKDNLNSQRWDMVKHLRKDHHQVCADDSTDYAQLGSALVTLGLRPTRDLANVKADPSLDSIETSTFTISKRAA